MSITGLLTSFSPEHVTPAMALGIDFIATWVVQTGYLWMKFGQISKETAQTSKG